MSDLMEDLYAEVVTAELSSNCNCEDDNGMVTDTCLGCYDFDEEDCLSVLNIWKARQEHSTNTVRIDGSGMTWQKLDGYAVTDFDKVLDKLTINGDFTIRLKLNGDTLTAVRSSHDEPTGASFQFKFVEEELTD